MEYKPTIGLEVHAEVKTKTKMFCACKNDTEEKRPNINICPICMGHPGTLPVINKEAVKQVLRVGIAVNGNLANESEFDRKNYFYPDIPKSYQISQYKYPLVSGGSLAGVALTRIHLEEDTAKSTHSSKEGALIVNEDEGDYSLVDFNRAGVPLMELVTEPVIHSAIEVSNFGEELQKLLQYLGVSDANMEKGEMRLEANISVSASEALGTKVEVKNLNSFKAAERAVDHEIKRQISILESGAKVAQETRGWDERKQVTFAQRSKEDSHDYRYFPDPDLPKLRLSDLAEFGFDKLKAEIKETPAEKRARLSMMYGIKDSDIAFYISSMKLGALFEEAAQKFDEKKDFQTLSNYIVSDVAGLGEKGESIDPEMVAKVVKMFIKGEISSRGAKDLLMHISKDETKTDPQVLAEQHGLIQKSGEVELTEIAKGIIVEHPAVVSDYKSGKVSALQFLVGQGMKATKGSANPQIIKAIFEKLIG
jgi:aspartyl-tRNA(Asn)/glutamyl-tRNA(Gln) amidotransferase subunit B